MLPEFSTNFTPKHLMQKKTHNMANLRELQARIRIAHPVF